MDVGGWQNFADVPYGWPLSDVVAIDTFLHVHVSQLTKQMI